jgi:hypothetical protein
VPFLAKYSDFGERLNHRVIADSSLCAGAKTFKLKEIYRNVPAGCPENSSIEAFTFAGLQASGGYGFPLH